ncbi:hypothetical protein Agabi119p4_5597 [Agaricus bisporus var. burnettii]|uniref:Uncharacterized protein n=1 Tax=Agaricus bisporus var. burnettii TaxID=192524 RepID=A0A8H7F1W5_AGABI|nr:hypothetical protein Agabi119p4_5597 [Agaricus bisporus var. burnettii]
MSQIRGSTGLGSKPDSGGSNTGSGKVYFHIFNGRKYCVGHSDNTITIEKVNDSPTPNTQAMWQMVRDGGNYTFKNRSTGSYIVLDDNVASIPESAY